MSSASIRSSYVPWLFVAGFAVVFAVNEIMISYALGSFSGLYADGARERGMHYNDVIAEQKARDALGWKIDAKWHAGVAGLEIDLRQADGTALPGAAIKATLVRPAEKRASIPVVLSEERDGKFRGHVDLPARGNWDLDIDVEAKGKTFAVTKRMFLE